MNIFILNFIKNIFYNIMINECIFMFKPSVKFARKIVPIVTKLQKVTSPRASRFTDCHVFFFFPQVHQTFIYIYVLYFHPLLIKFSYCFQKGSNTR